MAKQADSTHQQMAQSSSATRNGPLSGPLGIALFVALFASAGYLTYRTLTTAPIPPTEPVEMTFLCIETMKPFEGKMVEGDKWPVMSPHSGKLTGYPVERCYWTKDGKRKKEPTYVVLNESMGKSGDTICPDCGRLVVGHNPIPTEDVPLADEDIPKEDKPAAPSPTTQPAE